ncbi:MAG: insulinase family protein, partial [Rhodospirillaceae bacterium]|nr:insulinase family protein [Rhodospirillaceae bacterium]
LLRLGENAGREEVDRARNQLKAGTLMSLESSASRVEQLARQTLVFGRQIPVEELIERIDAVDLQAVRRVASRIAGAANPGSNLAVAALGPISGLASQAEIAARFAKG